MRLLGSSQTALSWGPFWDEDGRPHRHNPNRLRHTLLCSKGHTWEQIERFECPTCDFTVYSGEALKFPTLTFFFDKP